MSFAKRSILALVLQVVSALALLGVAIAAQPPKPATPRRFDNTVLHVEVSGHGRPIVFLPGLATSGEVYRDAAARFGDRYECHVVTLGGFGGTPRFDGPLLDTARDSLLAYFRARRLDHPVIVGHSLGGVLALELAIAAPDAIGPLVVLDALPFFGGAGRAGATADSVKVQMAPIRKAIAEESQADYAAFQKQSPYLHAMVTRPADYERVLAWAVESDHRAVADGMYEVAVTDLRTQVAHLRSPLLVLGTWYGLAAYSTRAAVEANFHAQYDVVPHWSFATADSAKHFMMLDDPEWTWSHVNAFLDSLSAAARRTSARR